MSRKDEVFEYILSFAKERGYYPTKAYITKDTGLTPGVVDYSMDVLTDQGLLEYDRDSDGRTMGYRISGMWIANADDIIETEDPEGEEGGGDIKGKKCQSTGRCFAKSRNGECLILRETTFKNGICPFQKEKRTDRFTTQMLAEILKNEQS